MSQPDQPQATDTAPLPLDASLSVAAPSAIPPPPPNPLLADPPAAVEHTLLPVVTLHLSPVHPLSTPPQSFHFDPIDRDLFENVTLKIGRQVNKGGVNARDSLVGGRECVWFKSKVVSRNHAEVWVKDGEVIIILYTSNSEC